jgi:ABC-type lipoprotein export system ATPase subunit
MLIFLRRQQYGDRHGVFRNGRAPFSTGDANPNRSAFRVGVQLDQGVLDQLRADPDVQRLLTAVENVELPLLLANLSKKQRRDRAFTALGVVGLADRAKHYPRQLSGGQEQRVGIARAIVNDPTLLLCDEPTGDLDRKAGDEILDLLQTLNREHGKTIVMVTHDPHAADRASRTVHLDKGQLTGNPS